MGSTKRESFVVNIYLSVTTKKYLYKQYENDYGFSDLNFKIINYSMYHSFIIVTSVIIYFIHINNNFKFFLSVSTLFIHLYAFFPSLKKFTPSPNWAY